MKKGRYVAIAVLMVGLAVLLLIDASSQVSLKPAIAARFPGVDWVDTETFAKWLERPRDERLLVLDVRTEDEYAVSHIEGARRLDPDEPDVASLQITPEDTVVVYCSVGYRSAAVVEQLERAGVHDVYNLEGGVFGWASEGRPVYRGEERVTEVHPYDRLWGRFLREDLRAPLTGNP